VGVEALGGRQGGEDFRGADDLVGRRRVYLDLNTGVQIRQAGYGLDAPVVGDGDRAATARPD
jgi:hypothetical protein